LLVVFAAGKDDKSGRLWLSARSEILINHLISCSLQPPDIRQRAQADKHSRNDTGSTAPPSLQKFPLHQSVIPGAFPYPSPAISPTEPPASISTSFPSMPGLQNIQPPIDHRMEQTGAWAAGVAQSYPYFSLNDSPIASVAGSPALTHRSLTPSESGVSQFAAPSIYHHPALSRQPSENFDQLPGAKRRRRNSQQPPTPPMASQALWSDAHQARFEARLARLTAFAGFSLSWIENPEWELFCQEFIPMARIPSRGVLTRRIIPNTLSAMQQEARAGLAGGIGTLQADGWTGINFHHVIAFMIAVNGKVSIKGLCIC
jgi:hypothetical protein